jgi:hypothetical protein
MCRCGNRLCGTKKGTNFVLLFLIVSAVGCVLFGLIPVAGPWLCAMCQVVALGLLGISCCASPAKKRNRIIGRRGRDRQQQQGRTGEEGTGAPLVPDPPEPKEEEKRNPHGALSSRRGKRWLQIGALCLVVWVVMDMSLKASYDRLFTHYQLPGRGKVY